MISYHEWLKLFIAQAPSSLLEALEGHLANLEGRKPGSGGTTPTSGGHRYEDIVKFTCYTIYDVLLNFAVFMFIYFPFYL